LDQQRRQHVAFGLMLLGIVCVVISVGIVLNQQADLEQYRVHSASPRRDAAELKIQQSRLARYWLLTAGGIFCFSLVAVLAMIRFRRRLLAYLMMKPAQPTPSEDVWVMYKLPKGRPDEEAEQGDDLSQGDQP
jgi:hypothetical protein